MIYALMRAVLVMKITQLLLNDLFMNKIMLFNKKEKKILFCFDFIMSFFVNGKKKQKKSIEIWKSIPIDIYKK